VLILGYGNDNRCDDAAGLVAARRLRSMGFDAVELQGDAMELMEAWSGQPEAIVIDAVTTGAQPGTITVWEPNRTSLPPDRFPCSTHGLGLAEAVELARVLARLPGHLTIYGIEAGRFDRGGPLSPEVDEAVDQLVGQIACRSVSA
jgi:hydrogenase maturation protease